MIFMITFVGVLFVQSSERYYWNGKKRKRTLLLAISTQDPALFTKQFNCLIFSSSGERRHKSGAFIYIYEFYFIFNSRHNRLRVSRKIEG